MNLNCDKALEASLIQEGKLLQKEFKSLKTKNCRKCKSCCCNGCSAGSGHYSYDELQEDIYKKQLEMLKKEYKFTEEKGFRGRFGCKIPYHLRSFTCLHFLCYEKYHDLPRSQEDRINDNIKRLFKFRIKANFLPDTENFPRSVRLYNHNDR